MANEEAVKRIGSMQYVIKIMKKRIVTWIGHILRHGGLWHTLECCVEGQ